ncbi:hypothetical protein V6O07_12080, partial [Arthrospira platensis SPKY2]
MRRFEKHGEHRFSVTHEHRIERVRNREDDVEVFARDEFAHPCLYPLVLSGTSAVRTMPVAARVELHLLVAARAGVAR